MEQFWQWLTLMKEPLTEVKKAPEPEPVLVATTPAPPPANPNPNPNEAVNAEKEEKRSNGAHTPVWALSELWSFWQECETSAIGSKKLGGGFCCFSKLDQLSPQDHRWTKQMWSQWSKEETRDNLGKLVNQFN